MSAHAALKRILNSNLMDIEAQIATLKVESGDQNISEMKDREGTYVLPPLLLAKSQTLHALAMIETSRV